MQFPDSFNSVDIKTKFAIAMNTKMTEIQYTMDDLFQDVFGISTMSEFIALFQQQSPTQRCMRHLSNYMTCNDCFSGQLAFCPHCFDATKHIGHNVRRVNGNGFCDCGIFRFGGFNECGEHLFAYFPPKDLVQNVFKHNTVTAQAIARDILDVFVEFLSFRHNTLEIESFCEFIKAIYEVFQAQVLYDLFGEVAGEKRYMNNQSFTQFLFSKLNAKREISSSFTNSVGQCLFVPLAMHRGSLPIISTFVLSAYKPRIKFLTSSLFQTSPVPHEITAPRSLKNFEKLLYLTRELTDYYFHHSIILCKQYNKNLIDTLKTTINCVKSLAHNMKYVENAHKQHIEEIMKSVINVVSLDGQYPTGKNIKFDDLINYAELLCLHCSDAIISVCLQKLKLSRSKKRQNHIDHFINFLSTHSLIIPILSYYNKGDAKTFSISQYSNTPITPTVPIPKLIASQRSVTSLEPLSCSKPITSSDLELMAKQHAFFKFYKKLGTFDDSIIDTLQNLCHELSDACLFQLIVWLINCDPNYENCYLAQYILYGSIPKWQSTEIFGYHVFEFLSSQKEIVCNPFVPFAYSSLPPIYMLLCEMFNETIGVWLPTTPTYPILTSTKLTDFMLNVVGEQPFLVLHTFYGKEFCVIMESLTKLSIEYDAVTPGFQKVFIEITNAD
ncbi:E3 ubiquitin-protein ligase [Entamoeba marina]